MEQFHTRALQALEIEITSVGIQYVYIALTVQIWAVDDYKKKKCPFSVIWYPL